MPASRWTHCLAQILRHEGGYVDHPSDPGGATNMGITHKTLARWRGIDPWWGLDKAEVRALTRTEAGAIYKALYWARCNGSQLPAGLDLAVFDYAVNSGPDRAIKALQGLVGVSRDGFIGPITLGAIAQRDVRALIEALCDQRMSFLERLSTFLTFGRGWTARVADVRQTALADAAHAPLDPKSPTQGADEMHILDGYKTYAVGALMLVVGLAQTMGIEVPPMGEYSGPQLVMEALAVIFLRRGLKGDLGRT
jgi:lysozyme family protein